MDIYIYIYIYNIEAWGEGGVAQADSQGNGRLDEVGARQGHPLQDRGLARPGGQVMPCICVCVCIYIYIYVCIYICIYVSSERRGDNFGGFKGFHLNTTARIWPWLPYMCHICSRVGSSTRARTRKSKTRTRRRTGYGLPCWNIMYRGTSLIRNCPPPKYRHRALCIVLL